MRPQFDADVLRACRSGTSGSCRAVKSGLAMSLPGRPGPSEGEPPMTAFLPSAALSGRDPNDVGPPGHPLATAAGEAEPCSRL